ncbi:zinc ribbon domain-containing protein [Psychrobacter aquaticus]|uniref:Zinc-ribbon domain-containing protein n=1 Tax=Psychrobacter aquaticus CMS 56 TaxID=1354303 RepID=U4TDP1_9GAMM|nr:zinc ribbon domain-containing protein [Psychrobacter aquaticus]ERL56558.1 hypothetical protein M917_0584 [Psychrobacter aquaticus CMS 56]
MLCTNCGQENSREAVFCSNCKQRLGNTHAQTPPPLTPVNISKEAQSGQYGSNSDSDNADTLLAAFVGEKYDSYYREKWFKNHIPTLDKDVTKMNMRSFNIAGLFLGVSWLCYRKMYIAAALIMFAITVIDLVMMYVLGMERYNVLGQSTFMVVWIVMTGILGNYLYFDHSVRQIQKITSVTLDPNAMREQLAKKGGTSWAGAIGVSIVIIALSILMTYFFAPEWYWLE